MLLEYILYGLLLLASIWMGYRRILRLKHLNHRLVYRVIAAGLLLLIVMSMMHLAGFFTQPVAAKTTMGLYTVAGGFFLGFGVKLIIIRKKMGDVNYMYRSFWTDIAPNFMAVLLVAFGIYRMGILSMGPFTGISVTSGFSLVAFGFWGWTLRVVPEFRERGLLILDDFIEWKRIISYEWISDDSLQVDYLTKERTLTEYTTYIPPEDQLAIERLLGKKMKEHEEERRKLVTRNEDQ